MNNFTLQGKVLYTEPPKEPGRSCLMVVAIGKEKEEHGGVIQAVNKVIVRVPAKLTHLVERYEVGSFIEMTGNISGRAHYGIPNGKPVATVSLIANTLQPCEVSHMVDLANIDKMLSCTWQGTGLVKAIQMPKTEGRPATVFLQIERPIVRTGELSQVTAVLPITVYEKNFGYLEKLEPQMAVFAQGQIHGLLRNMPVPGVADEFEQSLEVGLVLRHVEQTSIVPAKLYEARAPQKVVERDARNNAFDGEPDADANTAAASGSTA